MHKVLILACCAASIPFAYSSFVSKSLETRKNETVLRATVKNEVFKTLNKFKDSEKLKEISDSIPVKQNGTSLLKGIIKKVVSKTRNKQDDSKVKQIIGTVQGKSNTSDNNEFKVSEHKHYPNEETQKTFVMLQKIHARITRSKDAIWATITLTALCILLVLAVAQSRMWKDHYYSESQGVPLPNFNERVLFKDVMEHKMLSLKQFFKKKKQRSKEKNVTELESLLPPSEWDS